MLFSKYLTLAFASMAAVASAGSDADTVVVKINTLTQISQGLQTPANQIGVLSLVELIFAAGPFPQIIAGLGQIVTLVVADTTIIQGIKPLSVDSDIASVKAALVGFVQVHQALLNILIGKAGLLADIPILGAPVATVLRGIESAVDTIAFVIIGILPGDNSDIQKQLSGLDNTLSISISTYSGIQLGKRHNGDDARSDGFGSHHLDKRSNIDAPSGAVLASARINNKRSAEVAHGAGSVWRSVSAQ